MSVEPKPQSPGADRPSNTPPMERPKGEKPIGDPPSKAPPRIVQPRQETMEPGDHGSGTGTIHTEPLVKNSPQRERVGPGTYGNDQFAAEHHDDFVHDGELPEGLCNPREHFAGGPLRPTAKPKEARYGRIGGQGKG